MQEYIVKEIEKRVSEFKQMPYLFVGTGLSMRYANAPSWNQLLFEVWKLLNPDKKKRDYDKLIQKIEMEIDETASYSEDEKKYYVNPKLATELEKEFDKRYYSDDGFDEKVFSEDENDEIIDNKYKPFKYYVAREMKKVTKNEAENEELKLLSQYQNKFAGIITTNYDEVLESIFKEYSVLVGQDSLLVANSLNIFEIYKIHGSCTDPNSIILTAGDYDRFDKKLKYLSAKLLTIFVEHPIIFLGYGLGDVNIRKILNEISECLSSEQLEKIKDNFIFISPAFGKEEGYNKNTINWGKNSIIINEFILEDYSIVYRSMGKIQSSMPIKLARKLQDMVCTFVYSTEAQNNILFGDINSPNVDDEKVAIYFGKTETITKIGFSTYNIDDVLEDVLFDNKPYLVSEQLLEETFRTIRRNSGVTILPIYKYIKQLNYDKNKISEDYNIINSYEDKNIQPTTAEKRSYLKENKMYSNINEIEKDFPDHLPKQVANIKANIKYISAEDLEDFLKRNYDKYKLKNNVSLFRKLIAIYDFKRYSGIE